MVLTVVAALAVGVWLYLLLFRGRYWQEFSESHSPAPAGRTSSIVAVIPARNEADSIARAVASLVPQVTHTIVVDDGSGDDTAAVARRSAAPEKLTVLTGDPLPAGWTGKLWAVHQGVRHALGLAPEYLLLTDADIEHAPETAAALAARAESGNYDLVSYMATLHCATAAERALVPAFVYFFLALYPPRWIRNPRRRTAGAAGGCILIRREALERIGGIAAIREQLIDDCALARAVKRSGGGIWLGLSRETRSLRTYSSFREIERMIARTAFTQLRYSNWLLAATLAGLAVTYLLGPVLVIAAPYPAAIMGAAAWLLMSVSYLPAVRFYGGSPLWAAALPAIATFYAWATLHSAILYWRGAGGQWKDRVQGSRRSNS